MNKGVDSIPRPRGNRNFISIFTFSPNGQKFAGTRSTNISGEVFLWDVSTGELLWHGGRHKRHVASITFSPDNKMLASGSSDNTIRLWNTATGQLENILTDHRDEVNSVIFTPDSSTLMSGSRDKTIRVWDVATGLQKKGAHWA